MRFFENQRNKRKAAAVVLSLALIILIIILFFVNAATEEKGADLPPQGQPVGGVHPVYHKAVIIETMPDPLADRILIVKILPSDNIIYNLPNEDPLAVGEIFQVEFRMRNRAVFVNDIEPLLDVGTIISFARMTVWNVPDDLADYSQDPPLVRAYALGVYDETGEILIQTHMPL